MIVKTYKRRVRMILWNGHYRLQRWHIEPDGSLNWHGAPWPGQ